MDGKKTGERVDDLRYHRFDPLALLGEGVLRKLPHLLLLTHSSLTGVKGRPSRQGACTVPRTEEGRVRED